MELPPEFFVHHTFPAVAVALTGGEHYEDGQILLSHFLSSLSWVEGRSTSVRHWSGGDLPRPMGGASGSIIYTEQFYLPYLPDPTDTETRWALAFYREGLSLNHVAYQCLSFFKILNIFSRNGSQQKDWINANLPKLSEYDAKQRLTQLQKTEGDVGHYLYGSNRCAVAHAGGQPTADPEDPEDIKRLREDLPLVRALAALAIEQELGVKSALTVYREHLYELEGFRDIFGATLIRAITDNRDIPESEWPRLPNLSIRLAFQPPYDPLENMSARVKEIDENGVTISCLSQDQLTEMLLRLNFRAERLEIDVMHSLLSDDDGTAEAMNQAARVLQFRLDYLKNGILEVFNAETNRPLSRCDAFLPMNVDLGQTISYHEELMPVLQQEAMDRASKRCQTD